MEYLINLVSYLGIASLLLFIIVICLVWLFIRSAVASGTKRGIIDAHNEINGITHKRILNDIEEEQKGWE